MVNRLRVSTLTLEAPLARSQNGPMDAGELQHFADTLRIGIAKLRMKRNAFCRAAGISPNTLRALERGTQQPEAKTVAKIARILGMTPAALTHGKRGIDPGDPLLLNLNDEDLEVARAFHDAPIRVRQEVLGALQQRGRRGARIAPAVAELAEQLYELPAHTRQAFADMLAQFTVASHRGAGTEDPAPHRQTHHHKVGT